MSPPTSEPSRCAGPAACLYLALLGVFASAAPAPPAVRTLPASAQIRFQCTSTLHDFEGWVSVQPFLLTLSSNTWSARGAVLTGEMTTTHKARDRKMWEMLTAVTHPQITGELRPCSLPPPEGTNVILSLRIRDQRHELPVRITGWTETSETIEFHAAWALSLKQYGLKPPSVIGLVRVGDRVQLEARIIARKAQGETPVAPVRSASSPGL